MNKEIELKFKVKNDEWRDKVEQSYLIVQGYLPVSVDGMIVRIRHTTDTKTGDIRTFMAIKIKTEVLHTRYEYEFEIDKNESIVLFKQCHKIIMKTRHIVHYEGTNHNFKGPNRKWEIDEFLIPRLDFEIAETEFVTEVAIDSFHNESLPSWVGVDISAQPSYLNSNLAVLRT